MNPNLNVNFFKKCNFENQHHKVLVLKIDISRGIFLKKFHIFIQPVKKKIYICNPHKLVNLSKLFNLWKNIIQPIKVIPPVKEHYSIYKKYQFLEENYSTQK